MPQEPAPTMVAGMAAGIAIRTFLRTQARIIVANAPGSRVGDDIRHLHDLRVAMRRSRVVLTGLKRVLPGAERNRFRDELRWLGSVTGPCRDLDVLRAEIAGHLTALDPSPEPAASAKILDRLEGRRAAEQARVAQALGSDRCRRFLDAWPRFLTADAPGAAANAAVERVAAKALAKAAKRLRRRILALDEDTSTDDLHRIRIDGKKLRYLLELFRPLLPQDASDHRIQQLKQAQGHLGGWHDREQQQMWIEALMAEPVPDADRRAAERLLGHLDRRSRREKAQAVAALAALAPYLTKRRRPQPAST